jgi:hypothetical protein
MRTLVAALLLLVSAARAAAIPLWSDTLDRLDRALAVQSPGGFVRAELSGRFDLEGYYIDQRPPGLIFGGDGFFANPRLALFLDAHVGRHVYAFVQARFDRGFDPRASSADARADEYLLRYTPSDEPVVNLQVGKFATMVGNWVSRHDSWTNPFINAPLPYENVTTISDASAPGSPLEFLARRNLPDKKREWVPVIWGPSYASGVAVFGRVDAFDYALEVKNAALATRPAEWDGSDRGWDEPTVSGRLGWRPAPAWSLGASGSSGPYLRDEAASSLERGQHTHNLRETVAGVDAGFARRHLELWAELFAARFEVPIACGNCAGGPRVDEADTIAYYLEGRYKLTPALFAALRWNQQLFAEVDDLRGGQDWDRDVWRAEVALGYRFDRHTQAKVQYGYSRQTGDLQQGEQLVALQLTVRF